MRPHIGEIKKKIVAPWCVGGLLHARRLAPPKTDPWHHAAINRLRLARRSRPTKHTFGRNSGARRPGRAVFSEHDAVLVRGPEFLPTIH